MFRQILCEECSSGNNLNWIITDETKNYFCPHCHSDVDESIKHYFCSKECMYNWIKKQLNKN